MSKGVKGKRGAHRGAKCNEGVEGGSKGRGVW